MKNIVLTGLSGSGKSTLGKLLAVRTGRRFVDLDQRLTDMLGLSVQQLFDGYGEGFFRELEAMVVAKTAQETGLVIATGGGAVLRDDNVRALRTNGFIIYINRPVEQIAQDLDTSGRPLLRQGAPELHAMAAARRQRYLNCADFVLENSGDVPAAMETLLAACQPLHHAGLAVIGSPIAHSLSPCIQGATLAAQGNHTAYTAIHVPRGSLGAFLAGLRASAVTGCNVTLPHKEAILPLLDEVESEAATCGAVNTVLHQNGRLLGYNTDMEGLHLALKRAGHGYAGRRVLLLGTGGAAHGVARKALLAGAASLCILGRNPNAAAALAQKLRDAAISDAAITSGPMEAGSMGKAAAGCNLLINCTPLGMTGFGEDFDDLAFLHQLPKTALVCDLIYTPAQTTLLAQAGALGLATLNGLAMLIYQALLSQELFLGNALDKEHLYDVALAALAQTPPEQSTKQKETAV